MNKSQKILIFAFALLLVLSPIFLYAATFEFDPDNRIKNGLEGEITTVNPEDITTNTMSWILGLLGLISVIIVLYGGFSWMTAAGNEEKLSKAKKLLTYSIIGLIVILFAWVMVSFVFDTANNSF
ncbi:MAG: Mbov_0395 family pilin-like conjugal transfer protein [Candidatus Kerfeldbacteria bacterium]